MPTAFRWAGIQQRTALRVHGPWADRRRAEAEVLAAWTVRDEDEGSGARSESAGRRPSTRIGQYENASRFHEHTTTMHLIWEVEFVRAVALEESRLDASAAAVVACINIAAGGGVSVHWVV
eukprot:scaffold79049_cov30-Tisochrysis_lutea.AAC.2